MNLLFMMLLSYLVGTIPCGIIIAKKFKLGDLRLKGSGNVGGTNVARVGGKMLGLLTVFCDALKGALAVSIVQHYDTSSMFVALCGASVVFGHIFPVWYGFKGGKGIATTAGIFVVSDPWAAIFFLSAWLIVFAASQVSSIASIAAVLLSLLGTYFLSATEAFQIYCIIFAVILWQHRENIVRLYRKEEKKLFGTQTSSGVVTKKKTAAKSKKKTTADSKAKAVKKPKSNKTTVKKAKSVGNSKAKKSAVKKKATTKTKKKTTKKK
jgi:acyl phosphate:glycerol-3-phosphate acyltransferase